MGELALHATATTVVPTVDKPRGNAGLWWNKFCNAWPSNFEKPEGQDKLAWIKTLAGSRVGDEALLGEHARRRERLVGALGGRTLTLGLQARFVAGTGLEHPVQVGMLFHHTLGVPYLPGASIKGLTRAWAKNWLKSNQAGRVFGSTEGDRPGVGSVMFLDALPVAPVRLVAEVMTPHYSEWYRADLTQIERSPPADWYDPMPIPFLAVGEDQPFGFVLLPNPHGAVTAEQAREDLDLAAGWLGEALQFLGAGAKTAIGFGRFASGPLPTPEPVTTASRKSASRNHRGPGANPPAVGGRVEHISGGEGVLLGYEGGNALVDFGDGPETVPLRELQPPD